MGWGFRTAAALVGLVALGVGLWPLTLLAALYVALSLKKPRSQRGAILKQQVLQKPRRPWGGYVVAGALILLSGVALLEGGTYSPGVFFLGGLAVLSLPRLRRSGLASRVVPMKESVLLRNRLFPMLWYALAEVKLEAQDQARGVASMDGRIIVFVGKSPSAVQVVGAFAFRHRQAEDKIVRTLRRETRMLSQRGAHLLPVDSQDASRMLSLTLERLNMGTEDMETVSSLPFDMFTLEAKEGLVVRHRALRIEEPGGPASIPGADLAAERPPLLAELVEEIGERHGWPSPDEFSPFLASLDATRVEPLGDRLRTKGGQGGRVRAEAPGGTEVELTRAQLRMVARIYG